MSKHQNRRPNVLRKAPEPPPPPEPAIYQIVILHVRQFLKSRPLNREVKRWHYLVIGLIPALLTLLNSNWLFENGPHMDPWYYFGHFQHFPRFHNLNPEYPGERIVWILPGYILTHLLGQVPGVMALHILTFLACLFAFHYILVRLTDGPTALMATILLGCNAYFIGPNGWDFLEAQSWMFLLFSIALVIPRHPRRRWLFITLSSMAWFGLLYGYVAWAVFSPAYLYLVIRLTRNSEESYWRTTLHVARFSALGGMIATAACWGAYALMGGHGFFFAANLRAALYIGVDLKNNPWIDPTWIQRCTWLLFPTVAFLAALAGMLRYRQQKIGEHTLLFFHIFSFALLALWTLRPYHILAWDYRASIMLPGVFFVFALLVFRVPRTATVLQYALLTVIGAGLSVAPLGSRYLAENPPSIPVVLLCAGGLLLLACQQVFQPGRTAVWGAMVLLFSSISLALTPPYTSSAWRQNYDGYAISDRVSRVIRMISARLPLNAYPVFWVSGFDGPLSGESRAISCAFFTQAFSMWYFPRVTMPPAKRFPAPGSNVFLITEQKDVVAGPSYNLARDQMPARAVWQQRLQSRDLSYWITQLQTLPATAANIRRGFSAQSPVIDSPFGSKDSSGLLYRRVTLSSDGIYQFELAGAPPAADLGFGALYPDRTTWMDDAGPEIMENGAATLWFRLALKAGEPVDLGLKLPDGTAPPRTLKLSILRDNNAADDPASFGRFVERPYGNLLANSDFEDGVSNWSCIQGVVRPSSSCYHGGCMEYAGSARGYSATQKLSYPLRAGEKYSLGAWLRVDRAAFQTVVMGLWDESTQQWVASQTVSLTPEWRHFDIRFTNPTNDPVSVRFQQTSDSPPTIVIDDTALTPLRNF